MIAGLASITVAFLVTLAFHFYSAKVWTKERNRLINAVLARNPQEFALLNKQDANAERKPKTPPSETPSPDFVVVGMG